MLEPLDFTSLENAFHAARALDPALRIPFLSELQRTQPHLYSELQALLRTGDAPLAFLDAPLQIEPHRSLAVGEKIGGFEILQKIGEGGFAAVYLALELNLQRLVALKISPDLGYEGITAASMNHPNIVRVYSETILPKAGLRLLALEYIPGKSLEALRPVLLSASHQSTDWHHAVAEECRRELPEVYSHLLKSTAHATTTNAVCDPGDWVLDLGEQIARALCHAHTQGVLHLDVKAANILCHSEGRFYLTDFGISLKSQVAAGTASLRGGTRAFMAPEHLAWLDGTSNEAPTTAADIFSLGKLLGSLWELTPKSQAPNQTLQSCDSELRSLLDTMTAQNPKNRVVSAADALAAISAIRERRQVGFRLAPFGRLRRLQAAHPFAAAFVLILAPQILGSAINISYNGWQIVSTLSPLQSSAFSKLVILYNSLVYPVCILLALKVSRHIRRGVNLSDWESTDLFVQPLRLMWVVALGWLPGAVFFPLGIDLLAGPISGKLYFHFFLSITLSWALAATYSYLLVQMFNLRVHYPLAVRGLSNLAERFRKDVRRARLPLKLSYASAVITPLFATLLILWLPHETKGDGVGRYFQTLVTLLVLTATGGFFVVQNAAEELRRTHRAFHG